MIQSDHGPDRAVLSVCGDITDELVIDLVAQMRRQADERFYNRIELEITSNGGQEMALRYFIEALERFRSEGVSVTTRALTRASSAAAVMLSLGIWREAAPGATLLYHSTRAGGLNSVTSMSAAALHGILSSADSWIMQRLAERGLQAGLDSLPPLGAVAEALSRGDWSVVHRLLAVSEGAAEDAGTHPADGPETLERLRGVVARRALDAAGLGRLYGALFEMDTPISAALARELRLVDAAVAPGNAARPAAVAGGGGFRIPEWRAAFRPDGRLARGVLCRHVLILGETGSGKTASGVLPVVAAMCDPRNPLGCALVVDPKREIGAALAALARTGGVEVRVFDPGAGAGAPTLNLMSGPDWSASEDMEAGRFLTVARKILIRSASLSAVSPGGMLAGRLDAGAREIYWPSEGARLAQTVLALTLMLIARRREVFAGLDSAAPGRKLERAAFNALRRFGEEAGFLPARDDLRRLADEARADAESSPSPDEDDEEEDYEDALAKWKKSLAAVALRFARKLRANPARWENPGFGADFRQITRKLLDDPSNRALRLAADDLDRAALRCVDDAELKPSPSALAMAQKSMQSMFRPDKAGGECGLPAAALAKALRPIARGGEELDVLDRIEMHWRPMAEVDSPGQYVGVMGYGQQCFLEFGDAPASRTLYFGVEPRPAGGALDFAAAVDDERRRAIFLVQPRLGAAQDGLIAKALKAHFFEAVLNSPERQRRGGEMPLVGYVADECHRFVTSDQTHGEQSFLDTCRSFGAFCVLACQSASSLEHALEREGDGSRAALSILLNNTATKLAFRSTDEASRERLRGLCPEPGAGPKVVEIRPPSTLRPGECYAATADGRFERRQLEAFDLERARRRIESEARPDAALRPPKGGKHGPSANAQGRAEASHDL